MDDARLNAVQDAAYLAGFTPDMVTHVVRPDAWDPRRIIRIGMQLGANRDYESVVSSYLSIVRPEWFGTDHMVSGDALDLDKRTRDNVDHIDSAISTIRCDTRCDEESPHSRRVCCIVSRLLSAAECDHGMRLVVDGLPHRVTVRLGRWFVIGLRAGNASLHCEGSADVCLTDVGIFEGKPLHRLDQSVPFLPIEVLCASFWSFESKPKQAKHCPVKQLPTTVVDQPTSNAKRGVET
jgi:hypothetical protein